MRWWLCLLMLGCATERAKGPIGSFAKAGVTEAAAKPRRFALLVGIDAFKDERFHELRYARSDARALAAKLQGFDEVRVLANERETTRTALLIALDDLARRATDPKDTVVIYFSTHGSLGRTAGGPLQRYVVAHDTRMNLLSDTGLSVDQLIAKIANIPSRRKALILAMCHSGRGKSRVDDALSKALAMSKSGLAPLARVSEAVVVTTASAFGEVARESDRLEHDIYTHFLIDALEKGDRDRDGAVTISEAHDWARERTYAFSGGRQRPTSQSDILGKDPIVLSGERRREGDPVIYSYAPSSENVAVWVDGQKKGVLPGGVAIAPGSRRLQLKDERSGAFLYEGRVVLKRGQTQELSALLVRSGPRVEVMALGRARSALGGARSRYLPLSFGVGARAQVQGLGLEGLLLSAALTLAQGEDEAPGVGEALPYRYRAIDVRLGAGYALDLGADFFGGTQLQAGLLWAERRIQSDRFERSEALRGALLGGRLQLGYRWRPLVVAAAVQLEALFAKLGEDAGPHPLVSGELSIGYSF